VAQPESLALTGACRTRFDWHVSCGRLNQTSKLEAWTGPPDDDTNGASSMISSLRDTAKQDHETLCAFFDTPLRVIARRAVRVWFNRERLDRVLAGEIAVCPCVDLLYAIDVDGRQVSSNIYTESIDDHAYGQNLSRRPYSISLSVLNNAAFAGAFLSDVYVSQVTGRPCVTVMYGVTCGPTALGFLAADLDPDSLPAL